MSPDRSAVILDASTVRLSRAGRQWCAKAADDTPLACVEATGEDRADHYRALSAVRTTPLRRIDPDGCPTEVCVLLYVPRTGMVTGADGVIYRTGALRLPAVGLPATLDSDGRLHLDGGDYAPEATDASSAAAAWRAFTD